MVRSSASPILLVILATALVCAAAAQPTTPPRDKQFIFFYPDTNLDHATDPAFSSSTWELLAGSVPEIGYTLAPADTLVRYRDSLSHAEDLVLYATVPSAGSGQTEVRIAVVRMKELSTDQLARALDRPLVSMIYSPQDKGGMQSILVKKIVENLRTQYICYLSLTTDPPGATVRTQSGIVDRTPVNWVVPVGAVQIQGSLAHYLPLKKTIDLPTPGSYTYSLQLRKRQFYHSRFIYPAALFAVTGIVCYGLDRLYYDKYLSLGESDYRNNPDAFGRTFSTSQGFERAALASGVLSAVSLGISFWF
jgi:hypothetical protein